MLVTLFAHYRLHCWKQEVEEGHEHETADLARQLSDARAELAAQQAAAAAAAEASGKALRLQQGAAAEAIGKQRQQAAEAAARLRARLAEAAGEGPEAVLGVCCSDGQPLEHSVWCICGCGYPARHALYH